MMTARAPTLTCLLLNKGQETSYVGFSMVWGVVINLLLSIKYIRR